MLLGFGALGFKVLNAQVQELRFLFFMTACHGPSLLCPPRPRHLAKDLDQHQYEGIPPLPKIGLICTAFFVDNPKP